jgi:hypothetical protein
VWLILAVGLLASLPVFAQEQVLVDFGSSMTFLANTEDPLIGLEWVEFEFPEAGWSSGTYGIGYEMASGAQHLIATEAPEGRSSVYTRAAFSITDLGSVENLVLGVDYDDGFVAWINGVEVARSASMPPGDPAWNTPAEPHESSNGDVPRYEHYNISTHGIPELRPGENVLAIGVWNQSATSSDLLLAPQLVMNRELVVTRGPYLQVTTPNSVVVRWRTSVPVDGVVLCGDSPATLVSCSEDPALDTEHVHEIDGLAPGATYYYAIGTAAEILAGADPDHFFITHPPPGARW